MTGQPPPQDPNQAKPGWYAEPGGDQTLLRWWDGRGWTAQTQPAAGAAGPPPPYPGQPGLGSPPRARRNWFARHKVLTGLAAFVVLIVIIAVASAGGSGTSTTPSGTSAGSPAAGGTAVGTQPQAAHKTSVARVGSYFDMKDSSGDTYRVTLSKVIDPAQGADDYSTPDNGKRFVGAVFTITALSGSPQDEDANNDAALVGSDGQTYSADFDDIAGYTNFSSGMIHAAQGGTVKGAVTFQVPDSVKVSEIQWTASGFGSTYQWKVR